MMKMEGNFRHWRCFYFARSCRSESWWMTALISVSVSVYASMLTVAQLWIMFMSWMRRVTRIWVYLLNWVQITSKWVVWVLQRHVERRNNGPELKSLIIPIWHQWNPTGDMFRILKTAERNHGYGSELGFSRCGEWSTIMRKVENSWHLSCGAINHLMSMMCELLIEWKFTLYTFWTCFIGSIAHNA